MHSVGSRRRCPRSAGPTGVRDGGGQGLGGGGVGVPGGDEEQSMFFQGGSDQQRNVAPAPAAIASVGG